MENGPQSRLHNFRVGAAGPINLRPVFFSKFYPGNLPRPIYFKKVKFEVIVTSGECKEARSAVTFAGVSSINTNQANHLNLPAMSLHPGRAWVTHFCVKLRHYKILHSVPAPVFSSAQIAMLRPDCPYIELASSPGGIAPDAAKPAAYIPAPGLPGKTAPKTAAAILFRAMCDSPYLSRQEVL